jgi:hypothetical protein
VTARPDKQIRGRCHMLPDALQVIGDQVARNVSAALRACGTRAYRAGETELGSAVID